MRRTWDVHEQNDVTFVITCPWCAEPAKVKRSAWLTLKIDFIGRSCTYCFKTAKIPDRYLPERFRGRNGSEPA